MTTQRTLRFWVISAAALTGAAVTFALGQWQLERGRARDALQADVEQREKLPAVAGSSLLSPQAAELVHRAVVLRGSWVADRTIYLDNRQMRGTPGFFVVTPMKLEGANQHVLVQRGWAPRDFVRRENLPKVETSAGIVEVRGRIAPPPARLYELGPAAGGPIRQNLDIAAFHAETGLSLAPVSVVQTAPLRSEGLLRDWPRPDSGSGKNYGYAFQWWALSALIAILYVWFQFIAPRRKPNAR